MPTPARALARALARSSRHRTELDLRVAHGFFARARGLLASAPPAPGCGLLIPRCAAVHTFGMRYAIDVIFLDGDARVLAIHPALPPWRIRRAAGACAVLEMAAGACARTGIRVGSQLGAARAALLAPR